MAQKTRRPRKDDWIYEWLYHYCNLQYSPQQNLFHFAQQNDRNNDQSGWYTVAREIPMLFAQRFTEYSQKKRRRKSVSIDRMRELFYEWLEAD